MNIKDNIRDQLTAAAPATILNRLSSIEGEIRQIQEAINQLQNEVSKLDHMIGG